MRNVYFIAHRANSIEFFDQAIEQQFNAIEFDVVKHRDGSIYVWHGDYIGASSVLLDDYLDHVGGVLLADPSRRVSLLIVDLKYDGRIGLSLSLSLDDIRDIIQEVRTKVIDRVNDAEGASPQHGIFALYTTTFTNGYDKRLLDAVAKFPFSAHEGVNLDADFWSIRNNFSKAWSERFVRDALIWRNRNTINNLMLSAGYAGGIPFVSHGWKEILRDANAQRATHVFGTYAWTFQRARGGVNNMNDLDLDGIMGNANERFGRLPTQYQSLGLSGYEVVTRFDRPPFKLLQRD